MFWTFLLVTGLAAVFIKLGAASVTVSLLSVALQGAGLLIAILVLALLWKKFAE
jgi:membrane protein implicated in regulation of membrane protease activity